MAVIYILACIWIILANFSELPAAFATIFTTAFKPQAVIAGGFLAVFAIGLRRSAYSNEAGIGTAAIAHSAAKTNEAIREGIVALLEPFIDTVVICNMTALVIVLTGEYLNAREGIDGVRMTAAAFGSVIGWFPTLLAIAVFLFAFSTMISTAYYGEIAVSYVFGQRSKIVAKIVFILGVTVGASINTGAALDFTDMLLLAMAFPNLIGCYIMSGEVAKDLKSYMNRLKSGEMDEELADKAGRVSMVK
jgi:AGCS family alanine or glycine:cation symporter